MYLEKKILVGVFVVRMMKICILSSPYVRTCPKVLFTRLRLKYRLSDQTKARIMKHILSEAPTQAEMKNKRWQTKHNGIVVITDIQRRNAKKGPYWNGRHKTSTKGLN